MYNVYSYIEPSLKALLNELHPVRVSWYNIGLQLDIPHTTLDCFKLNYSDPSDLMREMLKCWLDTAVDPRPNWEAVFEALMSPSVNKTSIAEQLKSKYCARLRHEMKESNNLGDVENSKGMATYLSYDLSVPRSAQENRLQFLSVVVANTAKQKWQH